MPGFLPFTPGPAVALAFVVNVPVFQERNWTITGNTKDSTGSNLGGCTVRLFNTATNVQEQVTTSNAATGAYSFIVDKTQGYYEVAYKSGSPDVAGSTKNNLLGT